MSNKIIVTDTVINHVYGNTFVPRLVEHDGATVGLRDFYKHIGCDSVDVVRLMDNIDMWVDDEYLCKKGREPNWWATALRTFSWEKDTGFPTPNKYPPIFGCVVLCGTDEEGNSVPLSDEQIAKLKMFLNI